MMFIIELERNESKEMFEDWETANFDYGKEIERIEAEDIDEAAEIFTSQNENRINSDWDIEGSETEATIYASNTEDGLQLIFKIQKEAAQ